MEGAFAWLSELFQWLGRFIPQVLIVRATHGGVKWVRGKIVKELKPGWHLYWPITTDYEIIVTARQTGNLPSQVLMTADQKNVVVAVVIVYRIANVIRAIGEKNWNPDDTVRDIAQAAVVGSVTKLTLDELLEKGVEQELTQECRRQLAKFGIAVYRCFTTDLSTCRVHKMLGADFRVT